MAGLGGEGSNDAADEVTLLSAQLANAAADAIEQSDERELELQRGRSGSRPPAPPRTSPPPRWSTPPATRLDADDGANRVATFGAAVAGAHAAGVSAAETPPPPSRPADDICGSKAGLKQALASAGAATAPRGTRPSTPRRWPQRSPTAPKVCSRRTPSTWPRRHRGPAHGDRAHRRARGRVSAALEQDPDGVFAALQAVKTKAARTRRRSGRSPTRPSRSPERRARRQRRGERQGRQGRRRRRGSQVRGCPQGHPQEARVEEGRGAHGGRGAGGGEEAPPQGRGRPPPRRRWRSRRGSSTRRRPRAPTGPPRPARTRRDGGDLAASTPRKRKIEKSATGDCTSSARARRTSPRR